MTLPQPQNSDSQSQYQPIGLDDVRKMLDSRLVNTGVPGAIAGFGISRALQGSRLLRELLINLSSMPNLMNRDVLRFSIKGVNHAIVTNPKFV